MPIVAACSGGPDSTALVLALWALRARLPLAVHVVCVDHGLRSQAQVEAQSVCVVAKRLGFTAEVAVVRCTLGPSQMATARAARYEALARIAERLNATAVLVAHTQQDQSETLLMRWLAGAGLRGLCGMEPRRQLATVGRSERGVELLRPLLAISRAQIDAFLALGAELVAPLPVLDPTNADRRYQRSRLRHDLLPRLRAEQPQLDTRLQQLAAQLREDSDYLEQQAELAYRALCTRGDGRLADEGAVVLPLPATAALPPALFARVMQRASGGGLAQSHVTALRGLCAQEHGTQWLDLPRGRRVERRYGELRFLAQRTAPSEQSVPEPQLLPGCGDYPVPQGTLRMLWMSEARALPAEDAKDDRSSVADTAARADRPGEILCEARLYLHETGFPLTLRAPRHGDRIALPSGRGHRKISDVLIDLKVPRSERKQVRLLCQGDRILWVVGCRLTAPPPLGADLFEQQALLVARLLQKPGPGPIPSPRGRKPGSA